MKGSFFDLTGKVAIVTGSTKGLGMGIAEGLATAGAEVVITSRSQMDCDRVAGEIRESGGSAMALATDLTQMDQVQHLAAKVFEEHGRIDILVNNAGAAITKNAEDLTEEDWDSILNIDLKAVFFLSQVVGRRMIQQKKGKIINVASILGMVGDWFVLPYCVAKGGVIQMTRALALEWARHNIQVNALCPGYVKTDINKDALEDEKVYKYIINKTPARRLGLSADMAGAVIFMASDASDYMTGQNLVIDGGWTAA